MSQIDSCNLHESCLVVFTTARQTCPICEKIAGYKLRIEMKEDELDLVHGEFAQYKFNAEREKNKANYGGFATKEEYWDNLYAEDEE